jgi:hemerythrin superfamily protein
VDASRLEELKAVDASVQGLRAALALEDEKRWQADQRLIAMYSPSIQKRQI